MLLPAALLVAGTAFPALEHFCYCKVLISEFGTGQKISAVQQPGQLTRSTTDVPNMSVTCPGMTRNSHQAPTIAACRTACLGATGLLLSTMEKHGSTIMKTHFTVASSMLAGIAIGAVADQ